MFNSLSTRRHGAPAPSGQAPPPRVGMEELVGNDGLGLPSRAGMSRHAQEQVRGRFGKAGVRTWQRQPPRTDHKTTAGTSPVVPASAMPASTSSRPTASPALP